MGVIGRFQRRKDREAILKRPTSAKRARTSIVPVCSNGTLQAHSRTIRPSWKDGSRTVLPSSDKKIIERMAMNSQESFKFPSEDTKVEVSGSTVSCLQKEVLELMRSSSSKSCSVLVMAFSLAQSQKCRESHAKGAEDGKYGIVSVLKGMTSPTLASWERLANKDKEEMKRRYEWTNALNRLEKMPSSRETFVSSWGEAKACLEQVLLFPTETEADTGDFAKSVIADPIAEKYSKKLAGDLEAISDKFQQLSTEPQSQYRTVISQAEQMQKDIQFGEGFKLLIEEEERDLTFNATLRTAEARYAKLRQSPSIKGLEERRKLKEAQERASSLMRPLTEEEREIVDQAMYGPGPGAQVIAQCGGDTVIRQSMQTLQSGQWLNDEVIHYFLVMLANRDEEMSKKDPTRRRSHFFKSFFITKLLNEGNAACDGQYEYRNVKRWSKKVPGKDIFALDKIIFPINMGNMHWICAVIFVQEKRIQVYDSMGSSGRRYLNALFQYLKDEHLDKNGKPLPDQDEWALIATTDDTPKQKNGFDCGVFTCMFADFLSKDTSLVFTQEHITRCRQRIALSIMNGKAIM